MRANATFEPSPVRISGERGIGARQPPTRESQHGWPPASAAERMRAFRARQLRGHVVLRVEVDEVAVEEMLIDGGYLAAWDAGERARVETALAAYVTRNAAAFADRASQEPP